MKPAFVLQLRDRCGINDYTRALSTAIPGSRMADVRTFDASGAGLVHVQFEPTFFRKGRRSVFPDFMKRINTAKVVTVHEVFEENPYVEPRPGGRGVWNFARRIKYDFRHRLERREDGFAARDYFAGQVLVHTRHAKEILIRRGGREEKIEVIPMMVPATLPAGRAEARRRWAPDGSPVAVVFGFITPANDYETLLRAAVQFKPGLRVILAGGFRRPEDGVLEQSLRARINALGLAGRVTLAGHLAEEELAGLFALADLSIHPAKVKTASSALCRTLGAGLPAAADGGLAQVREINAVIPCVETYGRGDAQSLVRAVHALLEPGHNTRMRANASAFARRHSLENFVEAHLNIYRRLLAGHP